MKFGFIKNLESLGYLHAPVRSTVSTLLAQRTLKVADLTFNAPLRGDTCEFMQVLYVAETYRDPKQSFVGLISFHNQHGESNIRFKVGRAACVTGCSFVE